MKYHLRYAAAALFLVFSFSGCTMQDHVPSQKLVLKTIPVAFSNGMEFKVEVETIGDLPVTEYGTLYLTFFRASDDHDYTPRIDHGSKIKFASNIMVGLNTQIYQPAQNEPNQFLGKYFFTYRAYAILSDGSVVYGDSYNYTYPR